MVTGDTKLDRLLALARERGVLRPDDLRDADIPRAYLSRLVARGLLLHTGRGTYVHPDAPITEQHTLAQVTRQVPDSVVCLLSALRFHGLTTQNPHEVWIAVPRGAWRPRRAAGADLRVRTLVPDLYAADVEEVEIEGVGVRVYSPARTVADCFRHRADVGLDVALEALRDYLRREPAGRDALWRCAERLHVWSVLRPYLEAVS